MPNGDTRPQYGLPHQQLPAKSMTPESVLQQEIQTGRQGIYNKYNLQWKEAKRSAQFIGAAKSQRMQQEIFAKAKQEMLQFNQQAQQQLTQLRNVDRLAQQGAITNPEEIKARMAFGADVAKSMFPTPERERTIPQQFGELDVYSHRISQELERFKEEEPSKKLPKRVALAGPLMAGPLAAYYSLKGKKRKVKIWDFNTGDWRKTAAMPGEVAEYDMWLQEEKNVAAMKKELLGQIGIRQRRIQPGTRGGTFSDKIAESVRPQRQPTVTKPKVIRQRNTRTGQIRISYDGGKTWQTSG